MRSVDAPDNEQCGRNGMVIIDADGHAVDAEPVYRKRLPDRYRKRNFIHPSDGFDRNQNDTISMSRGSLVVHLTRANARGTESSQTRRWSGMDSNFRFRARMPTVPLCLSP